MQGLFRALLSCALIVMLAACATTRRHHRHAPPPPPPSVVRPAPHEAEPPKPSPRDAEHEAELARRAQADERIDTLNRRIDERVDQGRYPTATGSALHHRLDVIREEIGDMAERHGGGLSADEQRVIYQELEGAARAIGN